MTRKLQYGLLGAFRCGVWGVGREARGKYPLSHLTQSPHLHGNHGSDLVLGVGARSHELFDLRVLLQDFLLPRDVGLWPVIPKQRQCAGV